MSMDREHRWQAYVDGELSACEAAEFEATLTEAERKQLAADVRFDRALSERLREGAACPENVWARASAPLRGMNRPASTVRRRLILTGAAFATAVLAYFALPVLYPDGLTGILYPDVIYAAPSLEELMAESETEPGRQSVQAFLMAKGVPLGITEESGLLSPHHRLIKVIGVRQRRFAGARITEVFVNCCGRPVKLVLAPQGSRAARYLSDAAHHTGHVQSTRNVGEYTVATVALHPADQLLDLLTPRTV